MSAAALASALLAGSAASAQAAQTTQPAGMVNPPLTVSSNGNVSVDPGFNQHDVETSDGFFDSNDGCTVNDGCVKRPFYTDETLKTADGFFDDNSGCRVNNGCI